MACPCVMKRLGPASFLFSSFVEDGKGAASPRLRTKALLKSSRSFGPGSGLPSTFTGCSRPGRDMAQALNHTSFAAQYAAMSLPFSPALMLVKEDTGRMREVTIRY